MTGAQSDRDQTIRQLDALVAGERKADPRIDTATALRRAAEKNPALAKARNGAIALPSV